MYNDTRWLFEILIEAKADLSKTYNDIDLPTYVESLGMADTANWLAEETKRQDFWNRRQGAIFLFNLVDKYKWKDVGSFSKNLFREAISFL